MSIRLTVVLSVVVTVVAAAYATWGQADERPSTPVLPPKFARLLPLHKELGPPQPGEWLASHPEPGETFMGYKRGRPVRPTPARRTIYVQPLGEFSPTQRKIIERTARYMGLYFGLPVEVCDDLPLSLVPDEARRVHPTWGDRQVLTTYVLGRLLPPRMPKDAVAYIAFTTSDLWPGPGWNFVFGQASLRARVGVWSIYRNGDPEESDAAFNVCLRRTIKTATHETGHMFSMMHCIRYECNMCGSNHRAESDRHPLWLCPNCLAKLCWCTGVDPARRYEGLIEFCRDNGLEREQEFFEKSLAVLRAK